MRLFNIFVHKTALADLQDRVETLERGFKQLELEWSETFDKVRRTLAKIAKRDQREEEARRNAQEPQGEAIGDRPDPNSLDLNERIRASRRAPR